MEVVQDLFFVKTVDSEKAVGGPCLETRGLVSFVMD